MSYVEGGLFDTSRPGVIDKLGSVGDALTSEYGRLVERRNELDNVADFAQRTTLGLGAAAIGSGAWLPLVSGEARYATAVIAISLGAVTAAGAWAGRRFKS